MKKQKSLTPLTIKEAGVVFGKLDGDDSPKSKQTLNNWLHRGVVNKWTKERVFLQHDQFAGQTRISREQISAFIEALRKGE